jgi:drug/metabolite transporter (DMT)-like permease
LPFVAVLLVLGAVVCHTSWNLILKTETRRAEVSLGAIVVGAVVVSPVLAVYSLHDVPLHGWALIALSAVFETAYVLLLTAAYQAGDLSLVYPIARGTPPLLVVPLAVAFLGERPSWTGYAGIALVIAGIFTTHGVWRAGDGAPPGVATRARAATLAVITGVATAGYSLVNKLGVTIVPVPLYGMLVFALDGALLAIVLALRGQLTRRLVPRGRWAVATAVGVLMVAAYLAVLSAMAIAPVSYVVAAREVSIVTTALAGAVVLGEPHTRDRIVGAGVIFAGLVAIASSR